MVPANRKTKMDIFVCLKFSLNNPRVMLCFFSGKNSWGTKERTFHLNISLSLRIFCLSLSSLFFSLQIASCIRERKKNVCMRFENGAVTGKWLLLRSLPSVSFTDKLRTKLQMFSVSFRILRLAFFSLPNDFGKIDVGKNNVFSPFPAAHVCLKQKKAGAECYNILN